MILFGVNLPIIELLAVLHVLTLFVLCRILSRLNKAEDQNFREVAEQVFADDRAAASTPKPAVEKNKTRPKTRTKPSKDDLLREIAEQVVDQTRENPEEDEFRQP